jgi:S1-C subfamily serine protease
MRSFTLFVLATSVVATAAAQEPDRPRCRDCGTPAEPRPTAGARVRRIQDSLVVRGVGLEGEIEGIAAQLLQMTQVRARAQQSLEALRAAPPAQLTRGELEGAVSQLREQITQAGRQSQLLRARLASLCDRNAKPEGYMGITFSATMRADAAASGTEIFRFAENPTVETVEPGSPAERAGVEKGDEITLIDGRAMVGRDIVFSQLLRPGNRLSLRVRRDGDTRDLTIIVGQRPPSLDNGCPFLDARIMAAFGDPISIGPFSGAIVRATPAPTSAVPPTGRVRVLRPAEAPVAIVSGNAGSVTVTTAPAPMMPSVALPVPNAPDVPQQRSVFVFPGSSAAPMMIAGATIVRTNSDLRETFGVKSGVLVLDVARGSPAYASGLKGGDVIISAGRAAVTSPLSVQRAMEAVDGNELSLRIIRKKKEQSLTLKW